MTNMQLALVHKSASRVNNERLEYLGDSILDMLTAEYLYELYASRSEGFLSGARAELVCTANLASVGRRIGLGNRLILGNSLRGQVTENMLADAVEAQIGAMYLDYGLDKTREWVTNWILCPPDNTVTEIG